MRRLLPASTATAVVAVSLVLPTLGAVATPAAADPPAPTVEVERDGTVTYTDPQVEGVRELSGTLTEYVVESPSGASSEEYAVETAAGRLVPVEVRGELPEEVAGAAITAELTPGRGLAAAEIEPRTTAYAAGSAATAPHRAYVAKVTNQGAYGDDDATILATLDRALQRWVVETDSAIAGFTRVGAVRSIAPASCTSTTAMWNAGAAQFPGVKFGADTGNHLVVVSPPLATDGKTGCTFGVGTLGRGLADGGNLVVRYSPGTYLGGLMHEIGHNLGLRHADRLDCTTSSSCTSEEYGNHYDFMGITWSGSGVSALDSAQRAQLGVAGTCESPSVALASRQRTLSATYDVFGRGSGLGTRGLLATDPTTGTRYALDWRNKAGNDADAFYGSRYAATGMTDAFASGLTVEQVSVDGRDTLLLPSTETTAKGGRAYSRDPGETFATGGMSISVGAVEGTGTGQSAPVTVTLTDPRVAAGSPLPEQTGTVAVAGTTVPGATLTAATTGWAAATCFRYQWLADGVAVPGARQRTWTGPADRAGQQLAVRVVGQAPGLAPRIATSSGDPVVDPPSDPVPTTTPTPPPAPTPTGPAAFTATPRPTITGRARVGRTLRARLGSWAPSPTTVRYRWSAGGRPIAGATRSTYRIGKAVRGKRVTLAVTGIRTGYVTVSRTSRPTPAVRR